MKIAERTAAWRRERRVLDSVEIRLAGTAGPFGHLGQLDEPAGTVAA
jgi:hypothetical protein